MISPKTPTLFALLSEQAARAPDAVAVICGERAATYGDLAMAAARVAGGLQAQGVGRGDRIGILMENRLE
ncbi:MAG: AMP-binding protein, partial [Stellaceae bacterium]